MEKQGRGVIIGFIITFFLLFVGIGYVLLSSGVKDIRACSESAEGVVVENRRYSSEGNRGYLPIVEYYAGERLVQAAPGTVVLTNKINPKPVFEIGEKVSLRYDPQDPSNIRIVGYDKSSRIFIGIVMMSVGIVIPFLAYKFLLRASND